MVSAGEADASNAGRGWSASSEQQHALVVLPSRDVDGIGESPTSLQHRLTDPTHQLASPHRLLARAMPRLPVQFQLGVVLLRRLILDPEPAVADGSADTLGLFFAVDQSQPVLLAEADRTVLAVDAPRISHEEEGVCSSLDVDPTNQPKVDFAEIFNNQVDDSVVVNVCL